MFFCCATKACCAKFRVGNQGPTTHWDSDGPNGANTVPNSETVLIDWWTIVQAGITVPRNAKVVGAKIARMEGEYKKAFDFVTNRGQVLMNKGKDVTEIVKKMCPYYYELDPKMGSRAFTCPI
jgi:hypothetical protein